MYSCTIKIFPFEFSPCLGNTLLNLCSEHVAAITERNHAEAKAYKCRERNGEKNNDTNLVTIKLCDLLAESGFLHL